ncbi:MAG TPA: rhombotarget lipoprotein [Salinarimonas sp.]|nr:rhombotarget lipoprotein [Salinarimonas sp.]
MTSRISSLFVVGALALALPGCAMWSGGSRQHQSSSVVQFLYPDKDQPFIVPSIPTLRLPLRVGVAFVPPGQHGYQSSSSFPEARKSELLRQIAGEFKALPFVQSIEVIPTTYLRPGGGFENLDQLRALMGIDVAVLIAYDQAQVTNDTAWTFAYWTIIGAYVVPAQKNDTHTLTEAVVYDIASRKLLFRAPGVSAIKGHATAVRNDEEMLADSARGFNEAALDLTTNLKSELELFKTRIKEAPDEVRIEHKPGYSGAGSLQGWFATGALALLAGRFLRRSRR